MLNWKQFFDLKLARGHSFLASLVTPGGLVIDAGAHRCEFANQLAVKYGARIISLEPNSELRVGSLAENVTLLRAALAGKDGEAEFSISTNPEASSLIRRCPSGRARTQIVPTRSLTSLFAEFAQDGVDLVKLDVEGAEFEVLMQETAETLSRCKQISVEFHPHDARTAPDVARIEDAADRLKSLGFAVVRCSYQGYGDVLFVNKNYQVFKIKKFAPYIRKINEIFCN